MGIEKNTLKDNLIRHNIEMGIEKNIPDIKELEKQINYVGNINMINTFITFKLGYNTKNPKNAESQWGKTKRTQWEPRTLTDLQDKEINYGMPCGKINGFWVLDIDNYKDKTTCQFTSNFGNIEEYIKKNDIFAINTTSGGWHLYFAYNDWYAQNIKQTQNAELNLDIRSDGGFVVAPGSTIDKKPYTVFNMGKIDKCPPKLTMFLKDNLYKKKPKTIRNKIIKIKNPLTQQLEELEQDNIDLGVYKFGFTDHLIKKIFNNMPEIFYTEYGEWLKITTALKTLNKKEIWQQVAKQNVPAKHLKQNSSWGIANGDGWDGITEHNKLFMINHCLIHTKIKNAENMLSYYKYKPVPDNNNKPNLEINTQKLGYEFFRKHSNSVIVKSDTGTGKTTSFKHHCTNKKFISVVSRVSLGMEQMRIFTEHGIKCHWHEDITAECQQGAFWSMWEGDNIVITVDSLIKLGNWHPEAFKDYVIYLDEFNSLIEHLICSPTMAKTRTQVYYMLLQILQCSDKFIGTDADINDISLRYLQANKLEFKFIQNHYKHNRDIEAKEIFSFNKFIKKVKENNKWLICCDSKTQAEVIAHINTDYLLITSDGWYDSKTQKWVKGIKSLDSHDRVIYSPAILYGLDSLIKRPVFCYHKGNTIDPLKMVQQICRCRNIVTVYYLFAKKKWVAYKYHNFKEIEEEITEYQKYGNKLFNLTSIDNTDEEDKIYLELLAKYKYMADCFNTNKFAHFIKIMRDRGFILPLVFTKTSENGLFKVWEEVQNIKAEDLKKFDENYQLTELNCKLDKEVTVECLNPENFYPPSFIKINEILKIPWGQLNTYPEMFLSKTSILTHLTAIDYFKETEDYIKCKLLLKEDYIVNKTTTQDSKLLTLIKLKKMCQSFIQPQDNILLDKPLDKKTSNTFYKEYKLVFRSRAKKDPDFTQIKICQQYLVAMYKVLFGQDIITSKKSTKKQDNGKITSNTTYLIDYTEIQKHYTLYDYRHSNNIVDDDYTSSDEE